MGCRKDISGVIACSALKEDYRKILLASAKQSYILFLKGSYQLIANRLAIRQHEFMNPNLLHNQFETLARTKRMLFV